MWKSILKWAGILGGGAGIGYIAFKPKVAAAKVVAPPVTTTAQAAAVSQASGFSGFPIPRTVTTASTDLFIRSTPSATGAEVGTAPKGAIVQQTGPAQSGDGSQDPQGWIPIMAGTAIGFSSGKFLT